MADWSTVRHFSSAGSGAAPGVAPSSAPGGAVAVAVAGALAFGVRLDEGVPGVTVSEPTHPASAVMSRAAVATAARGFTRRSLSGIEPRAAPPVENAYP